MVDWGELQVSCLFVNSFTVIRRHVLHIDGNRIS
jgi:hypothetical protein